MTIYFIRLENDGPIKIGYTSGEAKTRMAQLQTAQPGKLKLLGVIDGDRGAEAGLHSHFESFRLNGEWFSPHPDLLVVVQYLIDNNAPWYVCRDKSVVYVKKIADLERHVSKLQQRLDEFAYYEPVEFVELNKPDKSTNKAGKTSKNNKPWFLIRIQEESTKRHRAEERAVLAELKLANMDAPSRTH